MTARGPWFTADELAGLPGLPGSRRGIAKRAERDGWQQRRRAGRGGGIEYHLSSLPQCAQDALVITPEVIYHRDADVTPAPRAALWESFDALPDTTKDLARYRLDALLTIERLVEQGASRREAVSATAGDLGEHASTLYRWRQRVKGHKRVDWLAALAPRYTGATREGQVIDPAAWDYFRADYLRPEAPSVAACYERMQRAASARGWQTPSLRTMYRLVETISRPVRTLAREGRDALQRTFPAQERDRSVFHAMEAVNADGHTFDVFVRWDDGSIGRPVMVAWQDLRSGKLLSYRVDRTEHQDLVRLSWGDMVERYGIPSDAYLDNGRGFAAKFLTGGTPTRYRFKVREEDPVGIITQMDTRVHWTTPYHGQAKPIERAFRDLCEYVAKHPALSGAYTGNSPVTKPDNYSSRAVPIAEFLALLDQEITAHNARTGRRAKICAGRSFDQVFAASYETAPIRRATESQRRLWLLAAEGVSASRVDGSVRISGNRYWSEALAEHAGSRLVVRFDPDQLHGSVHCYTADGRYVGEAQCLQAVGFNDTSSAREHARARTQWMRAQRVQLDAERRMSALDAAKQLPAPEGVEPPPERKVVRPAFGKGASPSDVLAEDHEEAFQSAVSQLWANRKRTAL